MSKFKVGDKVRCIKTSSGGGYHAGGIYTVSRCNGYTVSTTYDDNGSSNNGWGADNFELVTEAESELERLVRVANEGKAAVEALKEKYPNDVIDTDGDPVTEYTNSTFSIKPKPKFEPFTVGNGWQVKLEGETLHIGCKKFDARKFRNFLKGYCSGQTLMVQDYPSEDITHTIGLRTGIQFSFRGEKHTLRWEDSDKVLAALEKAGV